MDRQQSATTTRSLTDAARPKAYSYTRFSTPEQADGDSLRRQTAAAREYCAKYRLDLDEELTFHDPGMSAYRGRNAQVGALSTFLEAVRAKIISPGSYLLVESLDRVSRQTVRLAVRTMEDIVAAGVNLVDLSDGGRLYNVETLDNDPMAFLLMAIRFMRAHEESAMKSRRLLAAYEHKRALAQSKDQRKPFTRMLPAWLRWDEVKRTHVVIDKRADVVRSIFEKADEGWGQHRIALWLNERGVPTWGGVGKQRKAEHWHRSYVAKLLTNSAVTGTFTPHQRLTDANGKRKRKPLDPIEDYWPAVVDREVYERVACRIKATAPRGRNALVEPVSIFAGVLKCAACAGSVVRVSKGKYAYLVCSQAHRKTNGCSYVTTPYKVVEEAVRRNAGLIFKHAPRGRGVQEIDREVEQLDERLSTLSDQVERLTDELAIRPSEAVRHSLEVREAEFEEARDQLRALRKRRETLSGPYVLKRLAAVRDTLRGKPFKVAAVNRALKEAVNKIVIDHEAGSLTIHWRHADEPQEGPPFSIRPFAKA